ncbi:MAG: (Fe-S)-binding protein [Planctomycetota bacterium]|nr:(Fe-S)-binding protein [Planctomycetota bacterium]
MEVVSPFLDGRDMIKEAGGDVFRLCYQCGTCTGLCPWNRVSALNIRRAMHEAALGVLNIEANDNWLCVGCNMCVQRCPRGVKIIDFWRSLRRIMVESQMVPVDLRRALSSIATDGNPYVGERKLRADFIKNIRIKPFEPTMEYYLFVCCAAVYDSLTQCMAQALVSLLEAAGLSFGAVAESEVCCCEAARKAGAEDLFQSCAQQNIETFKTAGAKRIITISPHCYWTFKNEYTELGADFEVFHYTEILADLLKKGRLKAKAEKPLKVAYHDPCYLGRHSGIYDVPREVLRAAGYDLVEMEEEREGALCCGGGSGRIWMDTKKGERFADIRVNQASAVGAQVLAVACPYCYANMADSIITENKEGILRCADISQLLKEAL